MVKFKILLIIGNVMSHKRDQISFDIQLTNETNPTKSQECMYC